MKGMTISSLKQHSALVPLFGFLGLGAVGAAAYLLRMAFSATDVSWAHHKNPEHWTKIAPTYQYKFYSPTLDYSKLKRHPERPDI